jgi:hypothetical protein
MMEKQREENDMIDIVLLTRDPSRYPNRPNWVVSAQESAVLGGEWRYTFWGKGAFNYKGMSHVEAQNSLDDYVANRVARGYVEQARLKVYFPVAKMIRWVDRNIPTILALAGKMRVR